MKNRTLYNYVDEDKMNIDIRIELDKSKSVKDIFIIQHKKNGTIEVFNDSKKAIKFMIGKNNIFLSKFTKMAFLGFILDFNKDTNKYKTYGTHRIWKYNKTIELGNKRDIEMFEPIKNDKKIQQYLREMKLERILK